MPTSREGITPVPVSAVFDDDRHLWPSLLDRLCRSPMSEAPTERRQAATTPAAAASFAIGLETAGFFIVIGFFRLFGVDARLRHRRLDRPQTGCADAAVAARAEQPARRLSRKDRAEIALNLRAMWDNLGPRHGGVRPSRQAAHGGAESRASKSSTSSMLRSRHRAAAKASSSSPRHFANWEVMPFGARQRGHRRHRRTGPPTIPTSIAGSNACARATAWRN